VPASFELVLDSTAPAVAWGAVAGAVAGELLQLAYVADEPIDSADLTLADGRVLVLAVGAALTVMLPADTPQGAATVRVRDDVGNERVYPALVLLQGAIVVPPQPPSLGAPPRRRARRRARVIVQTTRLRTRTACTVHARVMSHSRFAHATHARVLAREPMSSSPSISSQTTFRLQSVLSPGGTRARAGVEHAIRRRDGPDHELLLLLL
jgi:hypothetical protein